MNWRIGRRRSGSASGRPGVADTANPGAQTTGSRTPHDEDAWRVTKWFTPASWRSVRDQYVQRREKEKNDLDVYRALGEAARPRADYYVLMVLSSLIATMGLIQDSVATIIGSMIIAPLMAPILAFSLGVIWGDTRLLRVSLSTLFRGIVLAIALPAVLSVLVPISHFSREIMSRSNPSIFDIIVALGSGALAAYGYANKRISDTLTGIAIAVALVPPLCTVGIALGKLDFQVASGAAVLFGINLVAISLSGAAVFWLMKIHPRQETGEGVRRRALRQIVLSTLILGLIAVPVGISMHGGLEREWAQSSARQLVSAAIPGSSVLSADFERSGGRNDLKLTVAAPRPVSTEDLQSLSRDIMRRNPVLGRVTVLCLLSAEGSSQ